jgi:alkanesulfonate monooxygenase SsuD/methylene tetrahydromethanopterin reductase-like flavin-dependent oxidoreductase (luciferase family)
VKIGITVPQFRDAAASVADRVGIDGVFAFDHLWAIGQPGRPALSAFPLLGAMAADTERVVLGTLVARVSLFADAVLVHHFETLRRMVGTDRVIAGVGTGDKLSEPENRAFALPYPPADDRRAALAECCRRLRGLGITTWVGGMTPATQAVARAEADALNLWGVTAEAVAAVEGIDVTWGGQVAGAVEVVADGLRALRDAGATWAVCAPPYAVDADPEPAVRLVAEAAETLSVD